MRRWSGVMAVATLVLTGACGSGEDGASGPEAKKAPLDVVLASSTKTAEAKTSKMAFTVVTQGVPDLPGGSLTITGEGAFDYATGQGAFTTDVPPVGGIQLGRLEAVSTGTTVYQKFPPQLASQLGGRPWVKIDLQQFGKSAGIDFNALAQSSSGDPSQGLNLLQGAGADIVEVGKEQLRGEEVTRYRGTLDMNKAAAAAPPEKRQAFQQLAQVYGQPLPVEVWIDGEERLRKMTYTVDLGKLNLPPEATQGQKPAGTLSLTMELFEFGTPVSITIPPADQVTDLSQLLSTAQRRR